MAIACISDGAGLEHLMVYDVARVVKDDDGSMSVKASVLSSRIPTEPSWGLPVYMNWMFDEPEATSMAVVGFTSGELLEVQRKDDGTWRSESVAAVDGGLRAMEMSPDKETIILLSKNQMLVMTKNWELLYETRFELSIGEGDPRIRWRMDGEYFVVAFNESNVRIFDRFGSLHAVVDVHSGGTKRDDAHLELHCLCEWENRPGGAIALPSKKGSMLFFETNGLRLRRREYMYSHAGGEEWESPVEVHSNCDGSLLAVCFPGSVQIWCVKNYVWYLKRSIPCRHTFACWTWDSHRSLAATMAQQSGELLLLEFFWSIDACPSFSGSVAVINGCQLRLTHLSSAILPPPLFSEEDSFELPISEVAFGHMETEPSGTPNRSYVVVLEDGAVQMSIAGVRKLVLPSAAGRYRRHPRFTMPSFWWCILESVETEERIVFGEIGGDVDHADAHPLSFRSFRTGSVTNLAITGSQPRTVLVTLSSGEVLELVEQEDKIVSRRSLSLDTSWAVLHIALCKSFSHSHISVLLLEDGCLWAAFVDHVSDSTRLQMLSSVCISFTILNSFVLATTRADTLEVFSASNSGSSLSQLESRPIDRGSILVPGVLDSIFTVLLAPRGNLETVSPRTITRSYIAAKAKERDFLRALQVCRRTRVDMNLIVESVDGDFRDCIPQVISQVKESSLLTLFITSLRSTEEDASKTLNSFCKAFVERMDSIDPDAYANAILTAHLQQSPPDFAGALGRVAKYSRDKQDSAVDYLIVLCKDVSTLYREALRTYDVRLAAMVASQSQMDPKEYGPFLRRLQGLPLSRRAFEIDDQLQSFESALRHLSECGTPEDVAEYAIVHELFEVGLHLSRRDDKAVRKIAIEYSSHLIRLGNHRKAGNLLCCVNEWNSAAHAYAESGQWRLSLKAAHSVMSSSEYHVFVDSLANKLLNSGNPIAAATIRSNHLGEMDRALDILLDAYQWEEAIELCGRGLQSQWDAKVIPAVRTAADAQVSDIKELDQKLRDRSSRLVAVRKAKQEIHEAYGDDPPENDLASETFTESDASSVATDFTFGSRTSHATIISDRAALLRREKALRRKSRRMENRKTRIREGHPREEEYLVEYLSRNLKATDLCTTVSSLLEAMVVLGIQEETAGLRNSMKTLLATFREVSEEASIPVDASEWGRSSWDAVSIDV